MRKKPLYKGLVEVLKPIYNSAGERLPKGIYSLRPWLGNNYDYKMISLRLEVTLADNLTVRGLGFYREEIQSYWRTGKVKPSSFAKPITSNI